MNTEDDLLKQQEDIFEQLKQFISEIIGADVAEELNITKNSIFTKDLEMDSIEIVTFAGKVNTYYGENIDFINWLYTMDLNTLINLSMESVINFISDAINRKGK